MQLLRRLAIPYEAFYENADFQYIKGRYISFYAGHQRHKVDE